MKRGGKAITLLILMLVLAACTTTTGTMPSNPQSAADLNAQLGLAYMEQGNDELAMQKLQHALKLDSNSADAHHYIAELYKKLGKNKEAEEHYRKALSLTPSNPMLLNNYGVFLCRQKRRDEARKEFLAAAKQPFYKTPEVAYNNAGLCALEDEDTAKAEEYFRDALNANPNMSDALYELADLKFKQQEYLHARAFVQRYLDVAPANPAILWLGVRVERNLGDEASAAKYAKQLQEKFPASQETALLRGQKAP
jgi:type IV pilus assembly protein PilF